MGLLFTTAAGPRQHSYFQVRVPRDSWPHFTVSDSRLPQTWRARFPSLYPPGTGWPSYAPRRWVPFSSPPTTRWATVEVFDHASTREFAACLRQPWIYTAFALASVPWLDEHRSGILANRERPCDWWKEVTKNISAVTWLMKRGSELL
jgi:hypothetical protein